MAVEGGRGFGQGDARVRDGDERHIFVDVALPALVQILLDDDGTRAGVDGVGNERVPVDREAQDGHEDAVALDGPAVMADGSRFGGCARDEARKSQPTKPGWQL